jgi:hypothetical protein
MVVGELMVIIGCMVLGELMVMIVVLGSGRVNGICSGAWYWES